MQQRMGMSLLHRAWDTWRDSFMKRNQYFYFIFNILDRKAELFFRQKQLRKLELCFNTWQNTAVALKAKNRKWRRAEVYDMMKKREKCFHAWKTYVARKRKIKNLAKAVATNHKLIVLEKCFDTWKFY